MHIGNHLGISFEIWTGRHGWFWFVTDGCGSGAAIGVAANYADAICEARSSIEEMAARRSNQVPLAATSKNFVRRTHKCSSASSTALGSNKLLGNPDHYFSRVHGEWLRVASM
jgi:hypothetical protein